MPKVESLSRREAILVRELTQNPGLSVAEAARRAGYAHRQSADEALARPRVAEHLENARAQASSRSRSTLEKVVRSVDLLSGQVERDIEAGRFTELERAQLLAGLTKTVPDLLALRAELGDDSQSTPREALDWLRAQRRHALLHGLRIALRWPHLARRALGVPEPAALLTSGPATPSEDAP
jgi:hypothetical protein